MALVSGKHVETLQLWERNLPSLTTSGSKQIFTLKEVSFHETSDDCWIIIYDRVYDLTDFLEEHPGGWEILLEYAGKDATLAFRGTGHSEFAIKMLDKYHIGDLPLAESIFRKINGFRVSGMPD